MDLIVVGAGISGAIVANRFAKKGKKVLVIEKRQDVAGNINDRPVDGIIVHHYGPHIFHTNNERVVKYMKKYWKLNNYKNRVLGHVEGKMIPIPFNFYGIDKIWPQESEEIKNKLISKYGLDSKINILELQNQTDQQLQKVATFVYDKIFANYTSKMWGVPIAKIDSQVVKRVPITIGYSNRYFNDKYEGIPIEGYSTMVDNLLAHKNIEVNLNTDAKKLLEVKGNQIFYDDLLVHCPIVYTGPLDDFFDYQFGELNYRSLKIVFEKIRKINYYQVGPIINYPSHKKMTRVTEYKYLTKQVTAGTIISREYPGQFKRKSHSFGTRYYPMMNAKSRAAYSEYSKRAKAIKNFYPLGRLATYQYINMDQAIALALELSDQLLGEKYVK